MERLITGRDNLTPLAPDPMECVGGGQFDPTELVRDELDLTREPRIRVSLSKGRTDIVEHNNPDHPARGGDEVRPSGSLLEPESSYSGIARAWRAEELEHQDVLPGVYQP